MNIKMIVSDMDGTMLNTDQEITSLTLSSLIQAQNQGIMLVIASGRSYRTLIDYGKKLEMDKYHGYFIGVNGGALYDVSKGINTIVQQLQLDEIKEVYEMLDDYEVEIMAVLDDTIYDYIPDSLLQIKKQYRIDNNIADDVPMTAGTFKMIVDQRKGYDNIHYIKSYRDINCVVNKICITNAAEKLIDVYDHCVKTLGHKYNFSRTSPMWIECTPKCISKGNAIKKLAIVKNIALDEIVVFGDGENDLSMFETVKYSVAMGNGMDSVKNVAYTITDDNNNDGIAKFIDENIFKNNN